VQVSGACPKCGHRASATQYVFYPGVSRVRCRGCRTVLRFPIPWTARVILAAVTLVIVLVLAALILEREPEARSLANLGTWVGATLLAFIAISYVEAAYALRKCCPVVHDS
jgi:prepilin signal peptidase PulO-like enzyme (type II secretory pathway)